MQQYLGAQGLLQLHQAIFVLPKQRGTDITVRVNNEGNLPFILIAQLLQPASYLSCQCLGGTCSAPPITIGAVDCQGL